MVLYTLASLAMYDLNQICQEIEETVAELFQEQGVTFDVSPVDYEAQFRMAVATREYFCFPYGSDVVGEVVNYLERLAWALLEAAEKIEN